MINSTEQDESLPDALVEALQQADRPPATISSRVDQSLDHLAAQQFGDRAASRRTHRLWYAAAASIVMVALVLQFQPVRESEDLLYTDVDGSGQIDIADVMALAMSKQDSYSDAELDAFALHVVSLGDES